MAQLPDEKPYLVWSGNVAHLEGVILTHLDAFFSDAEQRKAAKNVLSPALWNWVTQQPKVKSYEYTDDSIYREENQVKAGPVGEANEMGRQYFDHDKALEEN